MSFEQTKYISRYNKDNYKLYQFRVKKSETKLIEFLDNLENRNKLILSLIENESKKTILTINQIRKLIKPICAQYGIEHIWLFGSYARNEANNESDIDLLVDSLKENDIGIYKDLEDALEKSIDIVQRKYINDDIFINEISKDLIQLL